MLRVRARRSARTAWCSGRSGSAAPTTRARAAGTSRRGARLAGGRAARRAPARSSRHADRDQRRRCTSSSSLTGGRSTEREAGSTRTASSSRPRSTRPAIVGVAEGEWWRLLTAAFLHDGLIHLGLNMLVLWLIGPPLEEYSATAATRSSTSSPGSPAPRARCSGPRTCSTVGASGAIWGIMGAALMLEWRRIYVFGGQAMGLVVFNLAHHVPHPRDLARRSHRRPHRRRLCALAFSILRRTPALATLAVAGVGVALGVRRRDVRLEVAVAEPVSRRSRPR